MRYSLAVPHKPAHGNFNEINTIYSLGDHAHLFTSSTYVCATMNANILAATQRQAKSGAKGGVAKLQNFSTVTFRLHHGHFGQKSNFYFLKLVTRLNITQEKCQKLHSLKFRQRIMPWKLAVRQGPKARHTSGHCKSTGSMCMVTVFPSSYK